MTPEVHVRDLAATTAAPAGRGIEWPDLDWPRTTLHGALIRSRDLRGPHKLLYCYLEENVDHSIESLDRDAVLWSRAMLAAGLRQGDRVAVLLPGHSLWPVLMLAASRIGALVVGLNTRYRRHELAHILTVAAPSLVVTMPDWRGIPFQSMTESVIDQLVTSGKVAAPPILVTASGQPSGRFITAARFLADAHLVSTERVAEHAANVGPDDAALVQFTSGSTAAPKAVLQSHDSVLRTAYHITRAAGFHCDDRIFSALPFYHIGGSVCTGAGALVVGATMMIPTTYDATESVRQIIERDCTATQGHAAMFIGQIDAARAQGSIDHLPLRKAWAVCPPSTMRRIIEDLHIEGVVPVYGMSEYGLLTTCTRADPADKRVGTVGRVAPGTEIVIGACNEAAGQVYVRGTQRMMSYLNDPVATHEAIDADGWLATGDLGFFDTAGYLVFADREKDMIKPGGENVSAREVEEFLITHPAVSGVAVIGIPDHRLGEVPAAVVVAAPGKQLAANDLLAFCADQIASFKTPRRITIVDELPTLPNGKIDKRALRETYG